MQYRALALDLDGTLLTPQEEVSERTHRALAAARAAGMEVIVASARWRQLAHGVAKTVGTEAPLVACSGAQVWRPRDGHDLLDLRLPAAFAAALYDICDRHRCIATVAGDTDVAIKLDGDQYVRRTNVELVTVASLVQQGPEHPRIALIQGTETNSLIRELLEPEWAETVRFVDSVSSRGRTVLTLTTAGADKGVALAVACAELGIATEEVVAFGDAENDLEMFRVAGASVAMGQANAHVRAHATMVTLTNAEDGVAHAIERLLARGTVG